MAVWKNSFQRMFVISETLLNQLRAPRAVLLDPQNIGKYLLPKSAPFQLIAHSLCATWMVTWKGKIPPTITLHMVGNHFKLDCGTIVQNTKTDISFGEDEYSFQHHAFLYEETWKISRKVGIIFLERKASHNQTDHCVLVFLSLQRPLQRFFDRLKKWIKCLNK